MDAEPAPERAVPTHVAPALDLRLAAMFMVASALSFAVMGAAVKVASHDLPTTMSMFFRNSFALLALLPWAVHAGPRALRTQHFGGHALRAFAGLAAMLCFFTTISRARLADATVLFQAFPLFLPLIERAWFRRRVPPSVVGALVVGFGGVVCVLRPGADMFTPIMVVGIVGAACAAIAQVGIRQLTMTEPVTRIVFYFSLIASVVSAVPLIWTWVSPSATDWVALVVTGVAAIVGQLALTRAYSHATAASVGPFIYVGVLFAAVIDWVAWDTPPDRWFAIGAVLIISAGAALLRSQGRVDLEP